MKLHATGQLTHVKYEEKQANTELGSVRPNDQFSPKDGKPEERSGVIGNTGRWLIICS